MFQIVQLRSRVLNIIVFPGLFPEPNSPAGGGEGFAQPAVNFDSNPQFGYFVWVIYDTPASVSGNQVQLYRIIDAGSNTPTLGPLVTIIVPEFVWNGLYSSHQGNLFGDGGLLQNNLEQFLYSCKKQTNVYVPRSAT